MAAQTPQLNWGRRFFHAGERVAVAVSGGADSVALLLAMAESRAETGIVLSAIHVHHGLRGVDADEDARFVAVLAHQLNVPLCTKRGDAASLAAERGNGIEEAARALRYASFGELLAAGDADAVATAHTMDDQAETVLMKMLRGAWTEGLAGIAPVVSMNGKGSIVRPLLEATRDDVIAYLKGRGQPWREDSTNQELTFTRNRVRHVLLPKLREFQPRIAVQLSRMAAVARDEEAWWEHELARVLPGLLLPGKPARGGGRANSTRPCEAGIAIELERLHALHPALQRRVLRSAAGQLDIALNFDQTEELRALAGSAKHGAGKRGRFELGAGLTAERTAREIRLVRGAEEAGSALPEIVVPVPSVLEVPEYGYRVITSGSVPQGATLILRTPRTGDRVRLPHSSGVKTVKEVLERRGLSAAERRICPVLAVGSGILWMSGVEVERNPDFVLIVEPLRDH